MSTQVGRPPAAADTLGVTPERERVARELAPLTRYLNTLPQEQGSVTVDWAELERVVGPLPPSARIPGYWAPYTRLASRNWGAAGFTARMDRATRRVTFTRRPP